MNKISIIFIVFFVIIWYLFGKLWLRSPNDYFQFSDRDKTMVFPTPKTVLLDITSPSPTTVIEKPVLKNDSASDTSTIKF